MKPLQDLRILNTRAVSQQSTLTKRLTDQGADVIAFPGIGFTAPPNPAAVLTAIGNLETFDWLIFTSINAVDFFMNSFFSQGRALEDLRSLRIACIGPATARRLAHLGIKGILVPKQFVAESFIEMLVDAGIASQRILFPRAEFARVIIPNTLRESGAQVEVLPVYTPVKPEVSSTLLQQIVRGEMHWVTFTASSTVLHFQARFDTVMWSKVSMQIQAACIGPITAQKACDAGLSVPVVAKKFTIPGLVDALVAWRIKEAACPRS